ncbi:GD14272 [Drosophila simulans]|uniref:GD14272 n=1 Tax=Drosophila simulans TaxID=7240 RepID=B4QPM4_DROSI|nr:GD14272 [Drosophila simulans]
MGNTRRRRLDQKLPFHQRLLGGFQNSFGSPLANEARLSSKKDNGMSLHQCFKMWVWYWLLGHAICFSKFRLVSWSYMHFFPGLLRSICYAYSVDVLLCVYHFGVDCVYVVFIAKSLKHLGDMYLWVWDERLYMALIASPLILTFLIRDLKSLVPFAIISNFLLITGYFIILNYLFRDLPEFEHLHAIQPLRNFPIFFGTVLFSIESVGVILSLGRSMRNPKNLMGTGGVLNQGMIVVISFYAIFGFFGYWRYGENTSNSILQNMPQNDFFPKFATGMFALAIFFSYALQGYVTVDIIWRNYLEPELEDRYLQTVEFLLRIALVIASVLVAIQYPDFSLLLSFVGSFCLAQLGLILPGIVDICLRYEEDYGPGRIFLIRSMLFICMGFAGGVAGTVVTLQTLYARYPVVRR